MVDASKPVLDADDLPPAISYMQLALQAPC
jgi:hypothetical protein